MNLKHVPSMVVGGVAAVVFMLSCGDTGSDSLADAGTDGCGTCTVSGPIALEQPVQVKTADTDASRIVGGTLASDTVGAKLADGPLVLTDVSAPETFSVSPQTFRARFYIDSTEPKDCHGSELSIAAVTLSDTKQTDMHGGRFLVKAGEVLCVQQTAGGSIVVAWSGFRPYD